MVAVKRFISLLLVREKAGNGIAVIVSRYQSNENTEAVYGINGWYSHRLLIVNSFCCK